MIDKIGNRKPVRILDIGCGKGDITKRLRIEFPEAEVIGLDVSEGIMDDLEPPVVVGDAQHLPWDNDSFDVVLAMHMIYHIENINQGLAEMVRVLAPGGVLITSTNAADDKQELDDLWKSATYTVLNMVDPPGRIKLSGRFELDSAAEALEKHLAHVEVTELNGIIEVDGSAPVIDHFGSYKSFADSRDLPFDPILNEIHKQLSETIDRDGSFRIRCRNGIVTGLKSGS
ncbi:class I SAM-dependent methyltransferase [Haloglycomyces albus]|uniref:class I SAM-dependent methyltransferase n=1 Tax=Haloglycomyces albus TaxID=526067 RepID=UPI00316AE052